MKYYHAAETTDSHGQQTRIVSRTGYTGEDGLELIVPAGIAREIWESSLLTAEQPQA